MSTPVDLSTILNQLMPVITTILVIMVVISIIKELKGVLG